MHGFDRVTVAQVADRANVSVKTLFSNFATKEDLVFGDEAAWRERLIETVRTRGYAESVLQAVHRYADEVIDGFDQTHGVEGFHRTFADSPHLRARLRVSFDSLERALADHLQTEAGGGPMAARLAAAQLTLPLRILVSEEVRRLLSAAPLPEQRELLRGWTDDAFTALARGLEPSARGTIGSQSRKRKAT